MKPTSKDAGASSSIVPLIAVSVVRVFIALGYGWLCVGHTVADTGEQIPGNPFGALLSVADGTLTWPTVTKWIFLIAAIIAFDLTVVAAAALAYGTARTDSSPRPASPNSPVHTKIKSLPDQKPVG